MLDHISVQPCAFGFKRNKFATFDDLIIDVDDTYSIKPIFYKDNSISEIHVLQFEHEFRKTLYDITFINNPKCQWRQVLLVDYINMQKIVDEIRIKT